MPAIRTTHLLSAIGTIICVTFANASFAGTDHGGDASMRLYYSAAVERIYASAQLAYIGHEQREPLYFVTAASLLAWSHPSIEAMSPEISGGEPDAENPPKSAEYTPQSLLTDAQKLAGADQLMLALVEVTRLKVDQEIVGNGGPRAHRQVLQRGARAKYRLRFKGRQHARIAVVGSLARAAHHATAKSIDLIVLDEANKVVCESRNWVDFEYCQWEPSHDADFWIVVENNGHWSNTYTLVMN